MSDLLLDNETWDLSVVDGDLVFITDKATLARQAVAMTLKAYKGEWIFDIGYGTPWLENDNNDIQMLGKMSKTMFDSYARGAILSNPEIISIVSYQSTKDPLSGKVQVTATLEIEEGTITVSEEI